MNFGIKWECDLEKTNTSNFSIQKQGAPCGRTLPKATCDSDMYSREFPVGNALFFFVGSVMSLFRLPY